MLLCTRFASGLARCCHVVAPPTSGRSGPISLAFTSPACIRSALESHLPRAHLDVCRPLSAARVGCSAGAA